MMRPMRPLRHRVALAAASLTLLLGLSATPSLAADKTLRIGVQKYGTLVILRERATLEPVLAKLGWTVRWTEFPGGPRCWRR
jgi:sulfonate transport system substrate-binding protein